MEEVPKNPVILRQISERSRVAWLHKHVQFRRDIQITRLRDSTAFCPIQTFYPPHMILY
jgi:hypothetical protein